MSHEQQPYPGEAILIICDYESFDVFDEYIYGPFLQSKMNFCPALLFVFAARKQEKRDF